MILRYMNPPLPLTEQQISVINQPHFPLLHMHMVLLDQFSGLTLEHKQRCGNYVFLEPSWAG